MARYSGARWRPVARYRPGGSSAVRMSTVRRYILHTAVSSASSLYSWFSVAGRATSHFYIARDGTCEQYIDTAYRSTANLQGNHDSITVETQDMGSGFPSWSGSNVPSWTAAQVEALARLGAWVHKTHGVPLSPLSSSRPGTRGVGYHRQGIAPWRVSGGETWSNARGKVCPGDRRVAQIPAIIARAKALASGSTKPPEQEDDMVRPRDWTSADKRAVREALFGDDKYVGNRIVKHTDYNEDWHTRTVERRTHTMRAEQARLLEQQVAILAALEGLDADAVNAKLDQHHADYVARFEAAEAQRGELESLLEQAQAQLGAMAELVEQVDRGELKAEYVVDEIGRRLGVGEED